MPKYLAPLDLNSNELRNAILQNLGTPPASAEGKIYHDTVTHTLSYYDGSAWVHVGDGVLKSTFDANTILKADTDNTPTALTVGEGTLVGRETGDVISALSAADARALLGPLNLFTAPTGALSLNSQQITNLLAPSSPGDAVNKAYVDAAITGLDIKDAVRYGVTTGNINLASPGLVDGQTLAQGDRVLLMDQDDKTENGIYVYDGMTPTLVRAPDADTNPEVVAGLFAFVTEGTLNHDKGFVLVTDNPIVLDVTELEFTQFSGSGTVVGTTNRITVTGNQIDISSLYAGQNTIATVGTITTGTWQGDAVAVLHGGTGATTAPTARTNLGAVGHYATTVGNGVLTNMPVTHNLGTKDVNVAVRESATDLDVEVDWVATDANTVTLSTSLAPATGALTVVVMG